MDGCVKQPREEGKKGRARIRADIVHRLIKRARALTSFDEQQWPDLGQPTVNVVSQEL